MQLNNVTDGHLKYLRALPAAALLLAACQTIEPEPQAIEPPEVSLHESLLVMDSHLDTPALLVREGFDILARHDPKLDYSQVDYPRMIEGGLDGGYWVIFSSQGPITEAGFQASRDTAILRALAIHKMVAANPDNSCTGIALQGRVGSGHVIV